MLLPLKHNDNRPVSPELFEQTREELVAQFGGLSYQPSIVRGIWVHEGRRYEEDLIRLVVDVEDTPENHEFFVQFKAALINRFEQVEIYITSHPVDIL